MFANPLWSILILLGLLAVYGIIRWKHGGPLLIGNATLWDRIVAFRSWVATAIAGVLIAAPDLLVALAPVDLSPVIGEKWAPIVSGALAGFLALNRAFSTKPDGTAA
jgi:hypothetical protein